LVQRRPGDQLLAATDARGIAAPCKLGSAGAGRGGYGLADSAGQNQQQQQHDYQANLPATAGDMRALLSRALVKAGPAQAAAADAGYAEQQQPQDQGQQAQQQGQQAQQRSGARSPPQQLASPEKKLRSPRGAVPAGLPPTARERQEPGSPAGRLLVMADGTGDTPGSADLVVLLSSPEEVPRQHAERQPQQAQRTLSPAVRSRLGIRARMLEAARQLQQRAEASTAAGEQGRQRRPAEQQQQRGRAAIEQRERAAGANIRAFLRPGPPLQLAGAAGGQRRAAVAAEQPAADVVDLVTPPRLDLSSHAVPPPAIAASASRSVGRQGAGRGRRQEAEEAQGRLAVHCGSSPVDLTQDSDPEN
jgi:hypothetical protein